MKDDDKTTDKRQSKNKEEGSNRSETSDISHQPKPDMSSSSAEFTDLRKTRGSNKTTSEEIKQDGGKKKPTKRKVGEDPSEDRSKKSKPSKSTGRKLQRAKSKEDAKSEISDEHGGILTRSQKAAKEKGKELSNEDTKSASEIDQEKESQDFFTCKVCQQTFSDHDIYKKHKISCTSILKKHVCSKCGKSYSQKSLLSQHFDYRHTNKPKKFVCQPCGKSFELKKSLQEHNNRLHSDSTGKYLCDFCSRSFFHFGEFTVHRASHTGLKPYNCGRCQIKSFASADRLNKHLARCGINNSLTCNKCGKGYSNPSSLATHIRDVHDKDNVNKCPFCDKVYNSEGGYYGHLRIVHHISRSGKKLSSALIEQLSQESKENEEEVNQPKNKEITDDEAQKNSKDNGQNGSGSTAEDNSKQAHRKKDGSEVVTGNSSMKETAAQPVELTHKCPFPKCNDIVLANDEAYYKHLWDVHKLGRNK